MSSTGANEQGSRVLNLSPQISTEQLIAAAKVEVQMSIRKRLTEMAVDSFADVVKEKFEKIKELDLDKDGQKDIDQLLEILERCTGLAKHAIEKTDFQKLATGLEQIMTGINLVSSSVDSKSLADVTQELGKGLSKLGELGTLGIQEIKAKGSLIED